MNRLAFALTAPLAVIATSAPAAAQQSPRAAFESMMRADRDFSAAAAGKNPVDGLAAMFAPDVAMSVQGRRPEGREAVIAALRASPSFQGTGISWRPIGGTVSADGTHGFTVGYAEVQGGTDPARAGRRYLAYWVHGPQGWRVLAYRQNFRAPGEQPTSTYTTALPPRAVRANSRRGAEFAAQVAAAEKAFSDRAQQVGLREAFRAFGRPDAIHVLGENGFRIGLDAVVEGFRPAATSPLHWSTDRAVVASSGDLGVSIGMIYRNAQASSEDLPDSFPFFTVWRRGADGRWRYIAE